MKFKEDANEIIDIPFAKRTYVDKSNSKKIKILLFVSSFLLVFFSFFGFRLSRESKLLNGIKNSNTTFNEKIFDKSLLGHLPYADISKDKLVFIEPNIQVHIEMSDSLLKMREDAKKSGVYLVFLSGYRSINLQKDIFYSLKSLRNQNASERARVSAPPGYSEHSTGFAIDIGDGTRRESDFEVEFENTDAFRWLKMNAAKYHFKLSFDKNNSYIDYEPWHWRYEGSIEALKIFEASNRRSSKINN